MHILYLSQSYVPARRASSVQVMNMCAALARRGHDVTLVVKRADEPGARQVGDHAFYGVPPIFKVDKLARPLRRGGGVLFSAAVAQRVLRWRRRADLVFCRDLAGAALAGALGMPVVLEAHGMPQWPWQVRLWRRLAARPGFRGLVVNTEALRQKVEAAGLAPPTAPLVVAHNGAAVDPDRPARQGMPARPRIGYVGSLYPGRGVEIIPELAQRMPHASFEIVGGSDDDLARWRSQALPANVVLHGFQPPAKLDGFYAQFDVLLLPYPRQGIRGPTGTSGQDSSGWASPIKMFEYMASGVPIVASDLPVLEEVLRHERNALVAPAGDVDAWQRTIERLIADPSLSHRLASTALDEVRRNYTWDARATRVLAQLGFA